MVMMTRRIPSSSAFTCPWTYSVFLNFRGVDTRKGFTGHLYKALCDKGIKTFIDDEELQKGEIITPALDEAIAVSRIAIVIFSQNYASSKFCLEELVKIIQLMGQMHLFVLPVFYLVDPSDVRYQKGIFGEKFKMLIENRFKNDMNKVQDWKSALKAASDLSGWHFSEGYGFEYKLIQNIIDVVSKMTTRIPLHVANYPVGLTSRVQEVNKLLQDGGNGGVNMVGIYGIGGIGKTTIACAVYNLIADHFEEVCFLNDIRENSITNHDKEQLQKKLLGELLGEKDIKLGSVREGITIIKHMLPKKKVLLILDDVDKLEQLQTLAGGLDWFGSGSKIIITTRNKYLLDAHLVKRQYEVVRLHQLEALELFSWNAFKSEKVDPSYMDLSEDVVSYSQCLPLALVVIGSNLYERNRDVWKSALREYRKTINQSIYKVFKVSYDCLDEHQKTIFLDLACFFKGAQLEYVTKIFLLGRDLNPKYGIQELVDKSLVRIDQWNHVRMHDLIQEMAREIVRQQSSSMPGKRSRLWCSEDIIDVLEGDMGSKRIEVMMADLPRDTTVQWNGKAFKKMKNLKVLIIKFANLSTEIKHLPASLRLFEWVGYPFSALPSKFFPRNLVLLDLTNSCFVMDKPLENFVSLTHLDLSGNKVLTRVPDVSGVPNLIELHLVDCSNLTEVHDSVGVHGNLRILNAERCSKLSIFPGHIMMKSLEFLRLSYCPSLKNFPEISGKMENLIYISLLSSGIENLSASIQNLVGLERIELGGSNGVLQLPSIILTLPELEGLSVGDCSKFNFYCKGEEQEEQERVSTLVCSGYRDITLRNCNLTDDFLPTKLPCLFDWEVLRLESCNFTILPASIKEFPFLSKLLFIECKQLREIRELPPNIKEVFATNCTSLTFESSSLLLSEKFHKVRAKFIFLPGAKIPKWFDCFCEGPSLSFWFQKNFPSLALCAIVHNPWTGFHINALNFVLTVNGTQKIRFFTELNDYVEPLRTDHILVFDLETRMTRLLVHPMDGLIINPGWNHVELSCMHTRDREFLKRMGLYVYKQETNMKEITFARPIPPPKRFVIKKKARVQIRKNRSC